MGQQGIGVCKSGDNREVVFPFKLKRNHSETIFVPGMREIARLTMVF